MQKRLKFYHVPTPLHVNRLDVELAESIRKQTSIIEAVRGYDSEHAQEIRRTAELRLSIARETLSARHGLPTSQGSLTDGR